MTNYKIMLFVIAFWLFLPLPFMFAGLSNYTLVDTSKLNADSVREPTILDYIGTFLTIIGTYFQFMFLWISGIPVYLNLFIWVLRLISGFVIVTSWSG